MQVSRPRQVEILDGAHVTVRWDGKPRTEAERCVAARRLVSVDSAHALGPLKEPLGLSKVD